MRLVFLALLGRAARRIEIGQGGEALHALLREIAIGHRMAQDGDAHAALAQPTRQPARDRRLAAAGPHRRDGDDRQRRTQHRAPGAKQREIGAGRKRARARCITCSCATSL